MIPRRILVSLLFLCSASSSYSSRSSTPSSEGDTSPYCSQCNRFFVNNFSLQRHIKNKHSANRPVFQCVICNRKFATRYSLKRHILKPSYLCRGRDKAQDPWPRYVPPSTQANQLPLPQIQPTLVTHQPVHSLPQTTGHLPQTYTSISLNPPLLAQPSLPPQIHPWTAPAYLSAQPQRQPMPPVTYQSVHSFSPTTGHLPQTHTHVLFNPLLHTQSSLPLQIHQQPAPAYPSSHSQVQPTLSAAALLRTQHALRPQSVYVQLPQPHRQSMHEERTLQPAPQPPLPPPDISTSQELTELVATLTAKF